LFNGLGSNRRAAAARDATHEGIEKVAASEQTVVSALASHVHGVVESRVSFLDGALYCETCRSLFRSSGNFENAMTKTF
jgi:hypothetical protein